MSLSLIGILTIITIVALLIWNKTSPVIIMIILPVIGALIAGFGIAEIGVFFEDGIAQVMNVHICHNILWNYAGRRAV